MANVKVILKEKVEGLGDPLNVYQVKRGYAFNYLIPEGLAVMATPSEIRRLEQEKKKAEEIKVKLEQEAKESIKKLEGIKLEFVAPTSSKGVLYGSITEKDIIKKLEEDFKVKLLEEYLEMDSHFKNVGNYKLKIKVTANDFAEIEISIIQEK